MSNGLLTLSFREKRIATLLLRALAAIVRDSIDPGGVPGRRWTPSQIAERFARSHTAQALEALGVKLPRPLDADVIETAATNLEVD